MHFISLIWAQSLSIQYLNMLCSSLLNVRWEFTWRRRDIPSGWCAVKATSASCLVYNGPCWPVRTNIKSLTSTITTGWPIKRRRSASLSVCRSIFFNTVSTILFMNLFVCVCVWLNCDVMQVFVSLAVGKNPPSCQDVDADLVPPLELCIRTR